MGNGNGAGDFDDAFQELVGGLGDFGRNPIGTHETELRKMIGDSRYDEIVAYNDKVAEAQYEDIRANTAATQAMTKHTEALVSQAKSYTRRNDAISALLSAVTRLVDKIASD